MRTGLPCGCDTCLHSLGFPAPELQGDELPSLNADLIPLLDDADITVLFVDRHMRITRFTTQVAHLPHLIWCEVGRPLAHVFANFQGCDPLALAVQSVLEHPAAANVTLQNPSGAWLEARVRPVRRGQTATEGAVITLVDVTEIKRLEQALRDSEARYRAMVEWSLEAINIVRDGKFVYLNPTAVQLYGASTAQDLLGHPTQDRVHPEDRPMAQARMRQLTQLQVSAPIAEMRFLRLDGSVIHVQAQATWIDYEGTPAIHVAWRDISERKRSEVVQRESEIRMQVADEVLHLAFHDVLTQLPNRRVLMDRVNQTRIASKRTGCYAALMLLDLDNFKSLNDTRGHAAGDLLLIEVARRLQMSVRETDTVVRFGGDEFVVLLGVLSQDALASAEQASLVAGKIADVLKQPYALTLASEQQEVSQMTHVCSASIGVALFLHEDATLDEILKWADAAMYRAKKAGKNQIQFHTPAT